MADQVVAFDLLLRIGMVVPGLRVQLDFLRPPDCFLGLGVLLPGLVVELGSIVPRLAVLDLVVALGLETLGWIVLDRVAALGLEAVDLVVAPGSVLTPGWSNLSVTPVRELAVLDSCSPRTLTLRPLNRQLVMTLMLVALAQLLFPLKAPSLKYWQQNRWEANKFL